MKTGNHTIDSADGHYSIITADSHAGGSHAAYAEYLDPKYREEFDAWRGRYRNPFKDLGDTRRFRNWDNDMRNGQQEADGVVAEVIFPNTVPPFFPSFVLFATPRRRKNTSSVTPASRPTTVGWPISAPSSRSVEPGSARCSSTASRTR